MASDKTHRPVLAYWAASAVLQSPCPSTAKHHTRCWTVESSRAVRRADDANIPSAKRSVKVWRPHRTASRRKAVDDHQELYEPRGQRRSRVAASFLDTWANCPGTLPGNPLSCRLFPAPPGRRCRGRRTVVSPAASPHRAIAEILIRSSRCRNECRDRRKTEIVTAIRLNNPTNFCRRLHGSR